MLSFQTKLNSILIGILLISGHYSFAALEAPEFQVKGTRYVKTVLEGVLYRGGGPGGMQPLASDTLKRLCSKGFQQGVYLYKAGFSGPKQIDCVTESGQSNEFKYDSIGFRNTEDRKRILGLIHKTILEKKGPVYIHCWNGWHATGEIAALALMQFCGVSGAVAGHYWESNVGDKINLRNGKYNGNIRKVESFKPFPEFEISPELQAQICPKL